MRALVVDQAAKDRIANLIQYAQSHRFDLAAMRRRQEHPESPPGDDSNFRAEFFDGFKAVFTVEQHPGKPGFPDRWFRHLSVSVNAPGKFPNEHAVQLLMQEFGFKTNLLEHKPDAQCAVWPETNIPHPAINVLEPLDDSEL